MSISIDIIAGATKEDSSVHTTGSVVHIITNEELSLLGIRGGDLYKAVEKFKGKKPNNAYLASPTPWHDLYKKYGWPQVQTRLDVISSRIVSLISRPVAIKSVDYAHDENPDVEKATFTADLTQEVTETTETNWSETHGFEVGQSINYGVAFSGMNVGGETSLSYAEEFGRGGSETKQVSLSSTQGISFELDFGEKATATFSASRGTLTVEVVYRVSFTGDVAVNYNPRYKGHHFWALPINAVLKASGLQNTFDITQTIEVGYYTNGEIKLR
jgi:hypothetical protein